jgi:hypothetical protein
LKDHRLYAKLSKYEFWLKEVVFLEHVISTEKVLIDPKKIESISKWERYVNMTEFCSFLRLTGYYRSFIERFPTIATPLTWLTQKEVKWEWLK